MLDVAEVVQAFADPLPYRERQYYSVIVCGVTPGLVRGEPGSVRMAVEHGLEALAAPLTVQRLAAHASVSVRTFERQFRAETGLAPVRWLRQQRLLLARRLLEHTDEPVERAARRAGFGSPVSFRTHFRRELGTSPLVYRRTFRRATPPDDGGAGSQFTSVCRAIGHRWSPLTPDCTPTP